MLYSRFIPLFVLGCVIVFSVPAQKKSVTPALYYPPAGSWEQRPPAALQLDSLQLAKAIAFAVQHETQAPRNMEINHYRTFGKEPFGDAIGPFEERGAPTGLVVHKGYLVAQWGEPLRCDMTHSVTKSFLSATVGLAVDRGLIASVHDRVAPYVPPIELYRPGEVHRPADLLGQPQLLHPFRTPHNQTITWDHLLRQTSDWEGTLWDKPEWADRPAADTGQWLNRPRKPAGSAYEYNDVRVNVLALAATSVWRQPLPQVLKQHIMDPIGTSNTWRWTGYRNAWIVLDGQPVQSVSGGGHWGGGLFINAYDMARFGLLCLRRGQWNGRQLLSEQWIRQSLTPTEAEPTYGYMNWFLNTNRKLLPAAPPEAYYHLGNGANVIYVDPVHDLVVVVRWIDSRYLNEFIAEILKALPTR